MAEQVSLYQRFVAGQSFALFGGDAGLPPVPTPAAGVYATSVVWTVRNAATDADPGVLQKTSSSGAIAIVDTGATSRAVVCSATLTANDTLLIGSSALRWHDLKVTWSDGSSSVVYAGPILASPQLGSPQNAVASVTVTPSGPSVVTGATQQMTAAPKDAGNAAVVVGILWSSDAPAIATVDPSSGVVTGVSVGTARIVASAPNGVCGDVVATVVAPGNSSLPPAAQGSIAWAFDVAYAGASQTPASRVGPTGQLGSTTATDTNDPTYQAGPPARYAMAANQYVDFGSVLESVWTSAAGFTLMVGVDYESGDTGQRTIVSKARASGAEFSLLLQDGNPYVEIYDNAGGTGSYELFTATNPVAAGRQVVTYRYDPTQPRGSRVTCFVAGASVAGTPSTAGTGTSIGATATALRIGTRADGAVQPPTAIGNVYAWPSALTNQNISDNAAWLKTTMGWQ